MKEGHASAGQSRVPTEAQSHDTPNLPGAMVSPGEHPQPPQSCQPLGQHSLNCTTSRARTWYIHVPTHHTQQYTGSQLYSLRPQQWDSSMSCFYPT